MDLSGSSNVRPPWPYGYEGGYNREYTDVTNASHSYPYNVMMATPDPNGELNVVWSVDIRITKDIKCCSILEYLFWAADLAKK